MIQPNELRIGNWVYENKISIYPKQVALIGNDYVYLNFNGNEGGGFECDCNDINSIPLTEWVLAKCMFSEYEFEDDIFLHDEEDVCVQKSGKVYYPYSFENSDTIGAPIRYLHQLQNLFFALTGKELEVKL